jgi:TRAP-type C4-dicarboxylate transport system substrate-binding protein
MARMQNRGFILFLFLILFLTGAPGSASAQQVVLKMGTLAPEGTAWVKAFRDIGRELEQKTGKQVLLRIFPGGVLGDEEDMLRKIKVGQIQGVLLTGGGLGLIFKDLKILAIPFLFQNYHEVDAVMNKMDGFFRKGLEDNGFKCLGWAEQGFVYLFSREPIHNAADIGRKKVWIWEDTAMGRAVFKELGINPIPLSIPDILMALQTGMIDTVYASPLAAISMQWFTKVSYMTDVPLAYSVGAVVFQKSALEKIPAARRGTVEEVFKRHLEPLKNRVRSENEKAIQVLMSKGIKRVTPSPKAVKEFQAACARGIDTLGEDQFSKKTLEEIRAFLKSLRKEN